MNICTFVGSSDEKVRSRCHFAVTTDLNFDLLLGVVCVGVPFFNGSSGYQPYRLLIVFRFLLQHYNIIH